MRTLAQIISWLALATIIVPPIMYLGGSIELDRVKWLMLVASIVWFVTVPIWMGRKQTS